MLNPYIFGSADLDILESTDPSTLNLKRVIRRLWATAKHAESAGRQGKSNRAEALAIRLKRISRAQGHGGLIV